MKTFDTKSVLAFAIFIAYIGVLLKLIVFKYPPGMVLSGANLVPFETIQMYLSGKPTWTIATLNLVGNSALFMPLGFFAPFLHQRIGWRLAFLGGALFSLMLETLQLTLKVGSFDVDDVLLNILGVVLGYGMFIVFRKAIDHV